VAQPSFEAFLWSLTQQESGGNYGAVGVWVNGDRAYGRYQVMGRNIPSWTKRYYGRSLTPAQYLANRAAQDAVVRGVLGGYYKKYGAAGAAAMWYSGQPNPNKTYGNPPVKTYVNSVLNRAGGYSGGGATSSSTSGGVVPVLDDDELAASYGLSRALINSSKELKSLFRKAVSGGWSAGRFQASLKNTKWWKTQPTTLRQYLTQKYEDPATFTQKREAAGAAMKVLAVQAGIGADDLLKNGKWTSLLSDLVYKSVALGWTDARIKNYVGAKAALHGDVMYGEAGEAFDKLHALAYANGVTQSSTWYRDTARSIVSGHSTLEGQEANIRRLAAAKFSTFAEQIKAGQNAMDLAAPYINAVSQILEMPESDVDLNNKWVYGAMTGNESGSNYPLWKFENDVRSDPLWKKTNNARESMFGVAHQVAKDFGLVF
jgi:hypothetical protein